MRRISRRVAIGMVATLALTACSSTDDKAKASGNGPEKTLRVGVLAIADSAGLYIAQERGFFKAEGLTVQPVIVPSTADGMTKVEGGGLDVVLGGYMSVLLVQAEHPENNFRILADAAQAKPNNDVLVVPKDSPIKSVKDLKGKRVSIAAPKSIGQLAVDATLAASGLKSSDVSYIPTAFPDAPAKLMAGQFDASWLAEPFVTQVQQKYGARTLADTMTGAMADFPISGWVTVKKDLDTNPKAFAAFQRAMVKAQQIADTDRKAVEKVLPTYTKITAQDAAVITLGGYPASLNATRIQRVADTMLEYHYLTSKMDVTPLLVPMPQ